MKTNHANRYGNTKRLKKESDGDLFFTAQDKTTTPEERAALLEELTVRALNKPDQFSARNPPLFKPLFPW